MLLIYNRIVVKDWKYCENVTVTPKPKMTIIEAECTFKIKFKKKVPKE